MAVTHVLVVIKHTQNKCQCINFGAQHGNIFYNKHICDKFFFLNDMLYVKKKAFFGTRICSRQSGDNKRGRRKNVRKNRI